MQSHGGVESAVHHSHGQLDSWCQVHCHPVCKPAILAAASAHTLERPLAQLLRPWLQACADWLVGRTVQYPAYSQGSLREILDLRGGDIGGALDMLAQNESAASAANPAANGKVGQPLGAL